MTPRNAARAEIAEDGREKQGQESPNANANANADASSSPPGPRPLDAFRPPVSFSPADSQTEQGPGVEWRSPGGHKQVTGQDKNPPPRHGSEGGTPVR